MWGWLTIALAGTLEPEVQCADAPSVTYARYTPDGAAERAPLLVVIDPRGEPEVLHAFTRAADRFGWMVATPRGPIDDDLGTRWGAVVQDVQESTGAGKSVLFMAGLGSGSRVAWALAERNPRLVAGVLTVGAPTPSGLAPRADPGFAWYGLAGTDDITHVEARSTAVALQRAGSRAAFEPLRGASRWPSADGMDRALAFLVVSAETTGQLPSVPGRVDGWASAVTTWARSAYRTTDPGLVLASWPGAALPAWLEAGPVRRMRRQHERAWRDEVEYRTRVGEIEARYTDPTVDAPSVLDARRWLQLARLRRQATQATPRGEAASRMLSYAEIRIGTLLPQTLRARGYRDRADVADRVMAPDPES